jgi:hypothetical protein
LPEKNTHLGCLAKGGAEIIPMEPVRVMPGREMRGTATGGISFQRYEAGILLAVKRNAEPTPGSGDCFTIF